MMAHRHSNVPFSHVFLLHQRQLLSSVYRLTWLESGYRHEPGRVAPEIMILAVPTATAVWRGEEQLPI